MSALSREGICGLIEHIAHLTKNVRKDEGKWEFFQRFSNHPLFLQIDTSFTVATKNDAAAVGWRRAVVVVSRGSIPSSE